MGDPASKMHLFRASLDEGRSHVVCGRMSIKRLVTVRVNDVTCLKCLEVNDAERTKATKAFKENKGNQSHGKEDT